MKSHKEKLEQKRKLYGEMTDSELIENKKATQYLAKTTSSKFLLDDLIIDQLIIKAELEKREL
jgi:hypothetical protein